MRRYLLSSLIGRRRKVKINISLELLYLPTNPKYLVYPEPDAYMTHIEVDPQSFKNIIRFPARLTPEICELAGSSRNFVHNIPKTESDLPISPRPLRGTANALLQLSLDLLDNCSTSIEETSGFDSFSQGIGMSIIQKRRWCPVAHCPPLSLFISGDTDCLDYDVALERKFSPVSSALVRNYDPMWGDTSIPTDDDLKVSFISSSKALDASGQYYSSCHLL